MIDEQAGIDPPLPTPPWQRVPQPPAGRRRDPLTRDAIVQTAIRLLDQEGLDQYAFLRDAYLQRRRNQIYDGNPPELQNEPGTPRRKTLKEMEEELELDQPVPGSEAPEPPTPEAAPHTP